MGIMSRLARAWNVFAHDRPDRYKNSNYSAQATVLSDLQA